MLDLLIVDDEPQIRKGIKESIPWERYGIRVCATASSGLEALALIDKYMPRVVITDIRMPDMDGLELLEVINKKYTNIKVILISGYRDFEYARTAISLKTFCYLLKPIDSDKLLSHVLKAKQEIEDSLKKLKADQNIQKKVDENMAIIRENFLQKIVRGQISDIKEIKETYDYLGLDLDGPFYCVVMMQIDMPKRANNDPLGNESWYKAAVMKKVESMLDNFLSCHAFSLDDSIGFLTSGEELETDLFVKYFEIIREWANTELGIEVTIGIGNQCSNLMQTPISYREAMDALEYRVISGKNVVIHASKVSANIKGNIGVESFETILRNNEHDILYALRSQDRDTVYEILDDIILSFEKAIKGNIQEKNQLIFMLTFYFTKISFSFEIKMAELFGGENDFYSSLSRCQTVDGIKEFLLKYLEGLMQQSEKEAKSQNSFLVGQAKAYINENIYNNISLVKVADNIGIHPNYLSRIFKQEVGESFIEYTTKLKMQEAKLLLRSSNKMIYEISDALHYKDVGYFTRLFKKNYGVSPNEYRQLI
ncbi:MAG: response regulator [Clostridiales bacterium]|nr:response regulator [Clostridiales bacterium]